MVKARRSMVAVVVALLVVEVGGGVSALVYQSQKAELENRKLLLDIAEKEAKIRLMKDEAEAKVILKAVETDAELASQAMSKPDNKDVNIKVGNIPTKRKVKFKRDGEGRISGAEME